MASGYVDAQADSVDVLVTDEAHRIRDVSSNRFTPANKKSGLKQLEELIAAARVSVSITLCTRSKTWSGNLVA